MWNEQKAERTSQLYLPEESHKVLLNVKQMPTVNHYHTRYAKFLYAWCHIIISNIESNVRDVLVIIGCSIARVGKERENDMLAKA